ncbi:MAG TPA: Flp pilus assembly protein CpaB [Acidimicrobiales bacterium]|nr:Flp pilus assembly protein CpaB [Acidimicrobiales bacterium]
MHAISRPSPTRRRRPTLPRRPGPFWLLAVALAALTAIVAGRGLGVATADLARYGDPGPVLVAVRHVPAGSPLSTDDTEVRSLPAALVPDGAVRTRADGRVAATDLYPGEVVLSARLAPEGLSPVAALLPPGTRGVAVPAGPAALALRTGDVVDVLATFDLTGTGSGDGEPTFPVARRALVVDVGDDAVTLAVAPGEAARVAFALTAGTVTLLLASVAGP